MGERHFWCNGHRIATAGQPCCDNALLVHPGPGTVDVLMRNLELAVQNEKFRQALATIAAYGGGDGGDWVECCDIAKKALD